MLKNKFLLGSLMIGVVLGSVIKVSAEAVEAGFGKIKIKGLIQFWYQSDQSATPKDTFRLRRAEIALAGEIKPEVSWKVMIDPAQVREDDVTKSGGNVTSVGRKSPLQDFVITLKPDKSWSVDFGQFKVPFGMEGLESSAKLDLIERSALTSQFKWSDTRDIGLAIKGDCEVNEVKIQSTVGLFNGEGQNKLDANKSKDSAARLVIKPIETLQMGVARYNGKSGTSSTDNVRTGAEIKFVQDPIIVYGEYATGKSGGKEKKTYYLTAGYKFLESWQGVVRYDWYDPDTNAPDDDKTETTVGLNYFIEKHNAKIQLNYVSRGEIPSINNNVVRANIQISY